jgi:hypothetical protein
MEEYEVDEDSALTDAARLTAQWLKEGIASE